MNWRPSLQISVRLNSILLVANNWLCTACPLCSESITLGLSTHTTNRSIHSSLAKCFPIWCVQQQQNTLLFRQTLFWSYGEIRWFSFSLTVFELCVLTTASYPGPIVAAEWSRASTTHALLYMRRLTTGTSRSITWKLGRLNTWLTRTAIRWSSRWLSRCTMRPSTSSSSISARVTPHRLISALVLLSDHLSYVTRLP